MKAKYLLIVTLIYSSSLIGQLPTPSNYIIFFDLSSRIENPNQEEKDKVLLKHIVKNFEQKVSSLYKAGKIYSEDKLTILFYPDLNDENILSLTSSLDIDFGKREFHSRLAYFTQEFSKNGDARIIGTFDKIYNIALKQNPNYFGSNIHDFFSYSLANYLENGYNNHIIIFTDGYMYMGGENPKREENSVGHLEGSILDPLRASSNWEKKLVSEKWKILSTGKQLPNNTTITLLEVTPDCIANSLNPRTNIKPLRQCPNEFKILSRLWTDWFIDMDVDKKNVTITRTSNNLNGVKSILNELFVN